ncbi:MAG: hypothetical protein IJ514_05740 [Clostridia bacterium]|nr:hypothetical protein [Clostridia bacterium]
MLQLQNIIGNPVYTKNVRRGVCVGVGISLKNFTVKYLLCSLDDSTSQTDFVVKASSVESVENDRVVLTSLRPVLPKGCAKLLLGMPVYSESGVFCGTLSNIQVESLALTRLITENGAYIASAIAACADAVILRKKQPYPLGQRIPAHLVGDVSKNNASLVTKPVLRAAIQKNRLIKLTLSLAPFGVK